MMTRVARRARGMSLMEIMVGMTIGLIGVAIIAQVYVVNEDYKRATLAAGGSQTNGTVALFTLERDMRMAGYGFAATNVLGCQLQWYYDGNYTNPPGGGTLPTITLAPVVITDGGTGSDTITIAYAVGAERVVPTELSSNAAPGAALQVSSTQGFSSSPGDLIVLSSGGTCALSQVTTVSGATLTRAAGGSAPYNPTGGGTLPTFSIGTEVYNLGRPVVNRYSIASGNLRLQTIFASSSSTVVPSYSADLIDIIDNIVDLQAEYGKDTDSNGSIDTWNTTAPANGTQWGQVLAIRIAILARSPFYVKPAAGANCDASTDTSPPVWGVDPVAKTSKSFPAINLTTVTSQDRCYKYRVFETVVPLRNMIWRQS